jgi:hypothetical protein
LLGRRLVDGASTEGERADCFLAAGREQRARADDTGRASEELTTAHAEPEIGFANRWILY